MTRNLQIHETMDDTARAVAELIRIKAEEKHKKSLPFNLALSGGSTPKLLFQILANEYSSSIPWHFVRLFWVDERCVQPTHSESNFGMTYNNLLQHVPIHDVNVFRMQGEDQPEQEADRYQELLKKELPLVNGFPQFDLILLGIGDDGHTASIFPDNMKLFHAQRAVSVGTHPESGQKRITLTGPTINTAKQLVFLITGSSKAEIIGHIISDDMKAEKYPASYVHSATDDADFYLDQAAANNIN